MTTPNEVKALCERREWFVRDETTGNFVRAEPPVQFTTAEIRRMLEEKVADKALIESLSARNAEMVEALAHARQVLAVYQPEGAPTCEPYGKRWRMNLAAEEEAPQE